MRTATLIAGGALLALGVGQSQAAENNLGAGVWATYEYIQDNGRDDATRGDLKDEAFILYADGGAEEGEGIWSYSAELRIGPGSFTDVDNNSTGDQIALHKAWVGFDYDRLGGTLRVGKSQVPFGWKTVNFWPGDVLLAGYGDQMDVGLKFTGERGLFDYDLAYYHADDWGEDSTDTVDDNGHWGSSDTYRKVQTFVANLEFNVTPTQKIAVSAQTGRLQDLTDAMPNDEEIDGDHQAFVLWYHGQFNNFYAKASYIDMERDLPDDHVAAAGLASTIENTRLAAELGYRMDNWFFYLDASQADPGTKGSTADAVTAFAPGFSYDYGPGWIYVEYLTQDGFVDRNGQVGEGDFDALYVSMDFYL